MTYTQVFPQLAHGKINSLNCNFANAGLLARIRKESAQARNRWTEFPQSIEILGTRVFAK